METIIDRITTELATEPCPLHQDHLAKFHERFWRCRRLLQFTARRILGSTDEVERAVERCCLQASRNPPRFEREGEFRSWLLRILINEAVVLLLQRQKRGTASLLSSPQAFCENPQGLQYLGAHSQDKTLGRRARSFENSSARR
jgi:DNA-directed RNA polymerase specialized sigma24 family protein